MYYRFRLVTNKGFDRYVIFRFRDKKSVFDKIDQINNGGFFHVMSVVSEDHKYIWYDERYCK